MRPGDRPVVAKILADWLDDYDFSAEEDDGPTVDAEDVEALERELGRYGFQIVADD